MSTPSHKRNFPVTLDRAVVSRIDRIARGCRLHRSSVLAGLIAEGLEALESRFEHSPSDLRSELKAAVRALRRELARQRMWELIQETQCSTAEARERSIVEARRQAEREVGLPAGTLGRRRRQVRLRRDTGGQDDRQAPVERPQPPTATGGATDGQHPVGTEGRGSCVESGDNDKRALQPADPPPARSGRCAANGSNPHLEGDPAKSKVKAARKRPPRKRRRGPRRTALPRARRAYELRMVEGMGWDEIAHEVGYSPENRGQSAKEMAKRYALRHGYHWPLRDAPSTN